MKIKIKGITLSDGTPLQLNVDEKINSIIGYQAEHKQTRRLLPMCKRFEAYELFALMHKMGDVAELMDEAKIPFNIWEYEIVPIRDEKNGGNYIIIENTQPF